MIDALRFTAGYAAAHVLRFYWGRSSHHTLQKYQHELLLLLLYGYNRFPRAYLNWLPGRKFVFSCLKFSIPYFLCSQFYLYMICKIAPVSNCFMKCKSKFCLHNLNKKYAITTNAYTYIYG